MFNICSHAITGEQTAAINSLSGLVAKKSETVPFLKFAQRMLFVFQATVFYGQKVVLIV